MQPILPKTVPSARRVPLGNLLTRFVTGAALLALVGPAVHWLSLIDPSPARMTVNFHTAFSVIAAIVFLPLTEPVATLCRRLLPERPVTHDPGKPRHLDPNVLDTPAEALGCALRFTLLHVPSYDL